MSFFTFRSHSDAKLIQQLWRTVPGDPAGLLGLTAAPHSLAPLALLILVATICLLGPWISESDRIGNASNEELDERMDKKTS